MLLPYFFQKMFLDWGLDTQNIFAIICLHLDEKQMIIMCTFSGTKKFKDGQYLTNINLCLRVKNYEGRLYFYKELNTY